MKARYKIFTLGLAFIMLFNTLYVSLTYAYYYLDRADFIAQFCKNKDKPELKCNGKCHLKKVVKEEMDMSKDIPSKKIIFKEITLYFEKSISLQLEYLIEKKKIKFLQKFISISKHS